MADLRNIKLDDLFSEIKRRATCMTKPAMNIIMVGPPGAGKGTQGPIIKDELCICHLATGDLLRDAVAKGTELGKQAKDVMARGELVSDELVINLFKVTEQYRNMKEILKDVPFVSQYAIDAMNAVGITPKPEIIRGGTDGSRLSFMGLPCPNIFTGEMAIHSRHEYVSIQDMEKAVKTMVELVKIWTNHH